MRATRCRSRSAPARSFSPSSAFARDRPLIVFAHRLRQAVLRPHCRRLRVDAAPRADDALRRPRDPAPGRLRRRADVKDRWLVPHPLHRAPLFLPEDRGSEISMPGDAFRRFMPIVAIIMIAVPAALFGSVAAAASTDHYERLNTSLRPACNGTLAKGKPRPRLIVADEQPGLPEISAGISGNDRHLTGLTRRSRPRS